MAQRRPFRSFNVIDGNKLEALCNTLAWMWMSIATIRAVP